MTQALLHAVNQPIRAIDLYLDGGTDMVSYIVGSSGITRIEACAKPGVYCDIPYVRVWNGEVCEAEFCQHNIVGVYFGDPE